MVGGDYLLCIEVLGDVVYSGRCMNKDNKDNDVLSEYFEVEKDNSDVYFYTFKGIKCGGMSKTNMMYGKTIELNGLYLQMLDDVKLFFESGIKGYNGGNSNKMSLFEILKKITFKKYGVTINKVWKILNGNSGNSGNMMCMDDLYKDLIKLYGINGVDWMTLYNNMTAFYTNNDDVILYIANNILKGSIYDYFVKSIGLKIGGLDKITRINHNNTQCTLVKLEWDRGIRYVGLSSLMRNKRDWYNNATRMKYRSNIRDYDVFLNGRDENEMLPERCSVDNNIVLNYTAIDFSDDDDNNIKVCKNNNDTNDTWSPASIDRIDSTMPYSYDNIEIISNYYNTQVKNCANVNQTGKLYYYQLKRLLKSIDNKSVKVMDDNQLEYLFNCVGFTSDILLEDICDKKRILLKEMDKRYLVK